MGSEWVSDAPLLGTAHTYDLSCDRSSHQSFLGDDYEDALLCLREWVSSVD